MTEILRCILWIKCSIVNKKYFPNPSNMFIFLHVFWTEFYENQVIDKFSYDIWGILKPSKIIF